MTYSDFYNYIINFYGRISSFLPFGFALPPIRTTIEVSYGCNLHCQMCYQAQERKGSKKRGEITLRDIKKTIDQMPPKTLISLTGGELLTKTYAIELIKYANKNHKCNIVTNGTLINQEMANNLVDAEPLLIGVSLDGEKNTHDYIRGAPGAFLKTINGIKLIQKEKNKQGKKFPLIDIKIVILPENIKDLYKIYLLCEELRVDFFTISTLKGSAIQLAPPILKSIVPSAYKTLPKIKEDIDITILKKQFEKIQKQNGITKIRFYPGNLNLKLDDYFSNKIKTFDYFPCYFPWTSYNISPHGDVFPCISLNVGNIKQKSLWQIWNGKKMREFRQNLKKYKVFPACQGCCNLWFRDK